METFGLIFWGIIYLICGVGVSTMIGASSRTLRILMMLGWPVMMVIAIIDGLIGGLEDIFR